METALANSPYDLKNDQIWIKKTKHFLLQFCDA